MTRFIVFAALLAFNVILGVFGNEPEVLTVFDGESIILKGTELSHGENITFCRIKTSEGKTYEIYPAKSYWDTKIKYCIEEITVVKFISAGVWKITTFVGNEKFSKTIVIRVKQYAEIRPATSISATEGTWTAVWLDDKHNNSNVTKCYVSIARSGYIYDIMTEHVDGIERYSQCGIHMKINKTLAGSWEFYQEVGPYEIYYGKFSVEILSDIDDGSERVSEHRWIIGKDAKIEQTDGGITFCQLTQPDGIKLPVKAGPCSYTIPIVGANHNGNWTASYAKAGKIELSTEKFIVTTWDITTMESEVSLGRNGEINILCKAGETEFKFCSFRSPNNTTISVPAGIGNDKYLYYGAGFNNRFSPKRDYGECGLTIRKPSLIDFGLWTCEMGIGDDVRGAVINVEKLGKDRRQVDSIIPSSIVYVKRGGKFKIHCEIKTKLKYCWMTSPNGTAYSITPSKTFGTNLMYEGKGFAMGECGAVINNANYSDSGYWTCHLGLDDRVEIEGKVTVKVTDSYVVPSTELVVANSTVQLSCHTFRETEGGLRYCRWVRPNGHGINEDNADRYRATMGSRECTLNILNLDPEDIGKWTCIAALSRATDQEQSTYIEIIPDNQGIRVSSILSIVLGSGVVVVILIGAFFGVRHIYKRRNARIEKTPPPYCPKDFDDPHVVRADSDLRY